MRFEDLPEGSGSRRLLLRVTSQWPRPNYASLLVEALDKSQDEDHFLSLALLSIHNEIARLKGLENEIHLIAECKKIFIRLTST